MLSQPERKKKCESQVRMIRERCDELEEQIGWYDDQITQFKAIEPGCNSPRNLKNKLKAWKNVVPGCDTPQQLKKYIKQLEKGETPTVTENITEDGLSLCDYWNKYFIPYCEKKGIVTAPFSESEYRFEETEFLSDIKYENFDDPFHFLLFYRWLKDHDVPVPSTVEAYL